MIPVLAIPVLNRFDLLTRCLFSIDEAVERLVIIVNGDPLHRSQIVGQVEAALRGMRCLAVIAHPNEGVAASWNEAIKLFPAPWWMLVNNDIQFARGDLARMAIAAEARPDAACLYGNHGASFWIVTKRGIERVGLMDENFWPAYCEDCDWSTRADLLGVERVNVPDIKAIHGQKGVGSQTIMSDPAMRARNGRTHGRNMEYYRRKWGGDPGKEQFARPFNDPHWPLDFWRFEPEMRRLQMEEK